MSFRITLRNALLADPTVSGLVGGTRIFSREALQGADFPYAVYHEVDGDPEHDLEGPTGWEDSRMQIDVWSNVAAETEALAKAIRKALDGKAFQSDGAAIGSVVWQSRRDAPMGDNGLYGIQQDFFIEHRETAA